MFQIVEPDDIDIEVFTGFWAFLYISFYSHQYTLMGFEKDHCTDGHVFYEFVFFHGFLG